MGSCFILANIRRNNLNMVIKLKITVLVYHQIVIDLSWTLTYFKVNQLNEKFHNLSNPSVEM
jgi:hypothetical protein